MLRMACARGELIPRAQAMNESKRSLAAVSEMLQAGLSDMAAKLCAAAERGNVDVFPAILRESQNAMLARLPEAMVPDGTEKTTDQDFED